jgi:predicted amidohydrolase YtcJ
MNEKTVPDIILHNGRITTLDPKYPEATNLAIKDGNIPRRPIWLSKTVEYSQWMTPKNINEGRRRKSSTFKAAV